MAKAATIGRMGVRRCQVVVGPGVNDRISSSIAIEASSLYQAAVAGLDALRREEWTPAYVNDATPITVTVPDTGVTHTLRVRDIKGWLDRTAGTPNEILQRRQLRERLTARGIIL